MTINIKNFLKDKSKLSKMGEFQSLKQIDGLEMASISADLYGDGILHYSISAKGRIMQHSRRRTALRLNLSRGIIIHIKRL